MKQNYLKKLMAALLLLCSTVASAHDFEVDGIYYNILSEEDKTVEITSGDNKYTGAVTIPESVTNDGTTYSVTSIGKRAFYYCSGLTSIEIPNSVTSIGHYAFGNCTGLTSIEIPNSVTSMGDGAFYGCSTLTSVTISNSVTSIGDYAFSQCSGLTSIEIPNSVTSIGDDAFSYCSGLTSIEIPSSVTSIGYRAFYYCSGLTSIEIPNSVTSIGSEAFLGCTGLASIVVDENNTAYDSRENCNAIIKTASNTLIAGCKNTVIPNSVTSIGYEAFSYCSGLTSIEIPNSITSIGYEAFFGCTSLISIKISSSVTRIDAGVFNGCTSLESIVVDENNTAYDSRENCNAIIKTTSNTLIAGCENTVIPNSVTSIGDYAFSRCSGLTSIEIPNSVTSIGDYAFSRCSGLTSIVSHIAAEDLFAPGEGAFNSVNKTNCTLYVPKGAAATYAATEGWSDFTNIVEAYSLTVSAAGYATMFLDYAVEIPEGVEVYTADRIEGDRLKMQPVVDVIPANTGVIIRANEGTYSFAFSDETPAAVSGNLLTGTVADTYVKPAAATAYVLSQVDGVIGMYKAKLKADGTFKNNANKAYMLLGDITTGEGNLDTSNPGGQLSNGYRFDFSGTTAIESVEAEGAAPAVYYDLSGRRVENPVKGIYIVNGHKVFIK